MPACWDSQDDWEGWCRLMELTYRHPVTEQDRFTMVPGFKNFDPVRAGQLLAHDRGGEIHAPADGRLFLPLYQAVGEDGFFLVRDRSVATHAREG